MNLAQVINIFVLMFPVFGGYFIYLIQKKAKVLDGIIARLYNIEKLLAVIDNKIEYIEAEYKK